MEKKLFSLILLLFLFSSPVLAQDFLNTITSIITPYIGVIFILIFVLILLALGGVLPKPKTGFPLGLIAFLVLIVLLFVIPQFVEFPQYLEVPQSFKHKKLPEPAKDALELIGLPREWGYVPAIIYLFILPFAAIYTLAWAFLASLGIFPQANVNRILAFIIAFITIPMGWFTKMVWVLFSFLGAWSVAVFAATFLVGIFYHGAGVVAKKQQEFKKYAYNVRRRMEQMIEELSDMKKLPLTERKARLSRFLTTYEADLRIHDAWEEAWNAREEPTDANIDTVINKLKTVAKK
jgi:hypothetical protein